MSTGAGQLSENHIKILAKRSELHKVAMPLDSEVLEAWVLFAVSDLIRWGLLTHIDTAPVPYDDLRTFICAIYKLTPAGERLCDQQGILPNSYTEPASG